jgi:hypothetical protein
MIIPKIIKELFNPEYHFDDKPIKMRHHPSFYLVMKLYIIIQEGIEANSTKCP